MAFAQSELPS